MIKKRFTTPPATSAVSIPAIIMEPKVLENMKKTQMLRKTVIPREWTESVCSALWYKPRGKYQKRKEKIAINCAD